MNTIVLANPRDPTFPSGMYAAPEHLGLGYLAAALRSAGFEAQVVDGDAEGLSDSEVLARIVAAKPDLVGLTCTYLTMEAAGSLAEGVKARIPGALIVLGGEHAAFAARAVLAREAAVAAVCLGEGEPVIVEMAQHLAAGKDWRRVSGLAFRDESGEFKQVFRPAADVDALPAPARDVLLRCLARGMPAMIGFLTSRGCPNRCSFCNSHQFFDRTGRRPWRARDPRRVAAEVQDVLQSVARYGSLVYPIVYFYDFNFFGPPSGLAERVRCFAEAFEEQDMVVPFEINARADTIATLGRRGLRRLRRIGLVSAFLGLEAGTRAALRVYRKGTTPQINSRAVSELDRCRIASPTGGFIMFNPYTTPEEVRANAWFLHRIRRLTFWNVSQSVQVFPGSEMASRLEAEGLLDAAAVYSNALAYRFADGRVGQLSRFLSGIKSTELSRADAVLGYGEVLLSLLTLRLERGELPAAAAGPLARWRRHWTAVQAQVSDLTLDFLLAALAHFERGCGPHPSSRLPRFLQALSQLIDRAEAVMGRGLDHISQVGGEEG
ncbi:MAG: B12-binding domain-containing radical SAM protein [Acetobacteraceae bacterium]|nr:B12-binding domain-containing radical SAM protein [Acetobacteraceae bacterium]